MLPCNAWSLTFIYKIALLLQIVSLPLAVGFLVQHNICFRKESKEYCAPRTNLLCGVTIRMAKVVECKDRLTDWQLCACEWCTTYRPSFQFWSKVDKKQTKPYWVMAAILWQLQCQCGIRILAAICSPLTIKKPFRANDSFLTFHGLSVVSYTTQATPGRPRPSRLHLQLSTILAV